MSQKAINPIGIPLTHEALRVAANLELSDAQANFVG